MDNLCVRIGKSEAKSEKNQRPIDNTLSIINRIEEREKLIKEREHVGGRGREKRVRKRERDVNIKRGKIRCINVENRIEKAKRSGQKIGESKKKVREF